MGRKEKLDAVADFESFGERTSNFSLGEPTVEILQGKKESCSTRRSLRVDSGFEEFRQTP